MNDLPTNTFRRFDIQEDGRYLVIQELEPTDKHPMNWIDLKHTRESAWAVAQSQTKPVIVRAIQDGTPNAAGFVDLGVVFSPEAFERACYWGYVSYGHSMSDGYYAPIQLDSWVKSFRRDPEGQMRYGMDVSKRVREALDTYMRQTPDTPGEAAHHNG